MSFFSSMTQLNRFFPFPIIKFNPILFLYLWFKQTTKTQKIMGFEGKNRRKRHKKSSHI